MQIKNYIGPGIQIIPSENKQGHKLSEKSSKKLRTSIRKFLAELEGIMLIWYNMQKWV